MRCQKAHGLMSASLDGELSTREQDFLAAHLKRCAVCGNKFHTFQGMHRALLQAERFTAPPGLSRQVMARLDAVTPQPFFAPLWPHLAEAMVVFVIIGIGVVFGNLFSNSLGLDNHDKGMASLSLEIFDAAPRESVGGAYLAMLEVGHGK